MSSDDSQTQARACWLYFMEGMTQGEIAERLRTTRLRINRLLAEARASGLVRITLNMPLEGCVRLERRLTAEFGLEEAVIVPTPADAGQVSAVLGRAAAEFLSRTVEDLGQGIVGVGWGATLRETIRHVRPGQFPRIQVTSMMGGLTTGYDLNTFEIASELARRWNASCHYLAAPVYAGTRQSRDAILAQDVFQEAFGRLRQSDVAVLSLGDLTPLSLLIRNGLPGDVTAADLVAAGAVGDVLCQFIDAHGRPVAHPINERAIALPVADLGRIPKVAIASGGAHKTAAIAAVLRARLAHVLISDEQTVAAALDLLEREKAA